jgi:hypothetical protein
MDLTLLDDGRRKRQDTSNMFRASSYLLTPDVAYVRESLTASVGVAMKVVYKMALLDHEEGREGEIHPEETSRKGRL